MRYFGTVFGFTFLGSHDVKERGLVTSFYYSVKIKYTDSTLEESFFLPGTKLGERFTS